jgi:hypothetical protein
MSIYIPVMGKLKGNKSPINYPKTCTPYSSKLLIKYLPINRAKNLLIYIYH